MKPSERVKQLGRRVVDDQNGIQTTRTDIIEGILAYLDEVAEKEEALNK